MLFSIWPARSIHDLAGLAALAEENSSWPTGTIAILSGFIDGLGESELLERSHMQLCFPEEFPGAAGSVLLLQKWKHKVAEWEAVPVAQQERIMGRTKPRASNSRTNQRIPCSSHRSGRVSGIYFVAICPTEESTTMAPCSSGQRRSERLSRMLDSMAGLITAPAMRSTVYGALDRLLLFCALRRGLRRLR